MRIIELENATPAPPPAARKSVSGLNANKEDAPTAAPSTATESSQSNVVVSITAEATLRICKILLRVGLYMLSVALLV